MTSGESMEETVPKIRREANVEIMGFPTTAIVLMPEIKIQIP